MTVRGIHGLGIIPPPPGPPPPGPPPPGPPPPPPGPPPPGPVFPNWGLYNYPIEQTSPIYVPVGVGGDTGLSTPMLIGLIAVVALLAFMAGKKG